MGFLAALASLVAPMTARVLVALGFSVVTVTGVATAWSTVKDQALAAIGGIPADVMALASLGGVWIALGAVLGACSFVVALWGLTSATRIIGG